MARQLRSMAPFARAAAVTAVAAILAGALQAGPASAAVGARPDGGDINSMSCTSARDCAAVGELDFRHATRPLVVSEKNGTWGRARTVRGLSALPRADHFAVLASVSCSSAGNCGAGGYYQEKGPLSTAPSEALVVTERNGVWGTARAVRGLAALNVGGSAGVDFLSCRLAGDCTASGTYLPTACPGDQCGGVFVVSEKNGTWGRARPIRGLAAIDQNSAQDNALSCASPGNCTVAGSYGPEQNGAFAASQKNGVWGPAQTFPAIAAPGTDGASMDLLSCRPDGNCTGTGVYYTSDNDHVFAIQETNGTWGAVTLIPGIAGLPGGEASSYPDDSSLSCPSAGNCTISGTYVSKRDHVQMFIATEKNGRWGRAQAPPGLASRTGEFNAAGMLACFPAGTCTVVGAYDIISKSRFAIVIFVTAEKNGIWGKLERLPGSAALGIGLAALSCGAPGNCSVGGSYGTKHSEGPFVATEKNGTWGKAARVPFAADRNVLAAGDEPGRGSAGPFT
jgi:hypothetical protein